MVTDLLLIISIIVLNIFIVNEKWKSIFHVFTWIFTKSYEINIDVGEFCVHVLHKQNHVVTSITTQKMTKTFIMISIYLWITSTAQIFAWSFSEGDLGFCSGDTRFLPSVMLGNLGELSALPFGGLSSWEAITESR